MAERLAVPRAQQCAFCSERWLIAVGGQRLCAKHKAIVEEIAADAGVPVHTAVQQLTWPSPSSLNFRVVHT